MLVFHLCSLIRMLRNGSINFLACLHNKEKKDITNSNGEEVSGCISK